MIGGSPDDTRGIMLHVEVALRRVEPQLQDADLVVHFGPDASQNAKRVADTAIANRFRYSELLSELGIAPDEWLPVSVFATSDGYTLDELVAALPSRFFGTASYAKVSAAGYRLVPTDILVDGEPAPFSAVHFDALVPLGRVRIPDDYDERPKQEQKQLRAVALEPVRSFMHLFDPRSDKHGFAHQ